jgi:hypothetical protein
MTIPWLSTAWFGGVVVRLERLLGWRGCQTPMQTTHSRGKRGGKGNQVARGWAWLDLVLVVVLARLARLAVLPCRRGAPLLPRADRGPARSPGLQPSITGWLAIAERFAFGATRGNRQHDSTWAVDPSLIELARRLQAIGRGPRGLLRPALLTLPCSPSGRVHVRTMGL